MNDIKYQKRSVDEGYVLVEFYSEYNVYCTIALSKVENFIGNENYEYFIKKFNIDVEKYFIPIFIDENNAKDAVDYLLPFIVMGKLTEVDK